MIEQGGAFMHGVHGVGVVSQSAVSRAAVSCVDGVPASSAARAPLVGSLRGATAEGDAALARPLWYAESGQPDGRLPLVPPGEPAVAAAGGAVG